MMDKIFKAYEKIYRTAYKFREWLYDDENRLATPVQFIGMIVGIISLEYLYFTKAVDVRLLFVVLIILPGAIIGRMAAWLLYDLFKLIVLQFTLVFLAFITLGPIVAIIGLVIYSLYIIKI
ncbi:hypothetical protein [Cellvibrio sp. pealriver]|uniref:hypothetical protein n=1 Tax=Cellvibrio sp. pealriver TaxID=1622269 RepID=UPI00066FD695|nr:hypothetical protein [Cellvibrio sp. pealriver]